MPLQVRTKPVETLVARTDAVAVGRFVCPSSHPLFHDSGPCTHHTFVFPRTVTRVRLEGGPSFVADPTVVIFYNQHQNYTRTKVSDVDACDWYVVADELMLDAISQFDPGVRDRADRPFRFASAPIDSRTYLQQRRLFDRLSTAREGDSLETDEAVLRILGRAIESAYATHSRGIRTRRPAVSGEQIDAVKRAIAASYAGESRLLELARIAECSPFHLCRAFRNSTGMTITTYRHSLRMRAALGRLREKRADLTELALELGYSSHSHFTAVFRRTFGMPPSAWRAIP
ncbi:MAG: helix-turn-helix transcriptional regulator [Thermoanaerobaculia bacterium]